MQFKMPARQWSRVYKKVCRENTNMLDAFKISTEKGGSVFVLDFYDIQNATFFLLRYL